MSLRILLSGASGRMGRQVEALVEQDGTLDIVGRSDRNQSFDASVQADVIVDFSRPALCRQSLEFALAHQLPIVIGSTGLDDELESKIITASKQIPICKAANFSIGIEVLRSLVRQAAERLGPDFDIEISETHHKDKRDAPSGTALLLVDALGQDDRPRIHGRSGQDVKRVPGEIAIHAVRGGDVIGDHSVHFLGLGERVEISHRATDRSLFARGALRAARWLVGQPAGLYGVGDVIDSVG